MKHTPKHEDQKQKERFWTILGSSIVLILLVIMLIMTNALHEIYRLMRWHHLFPQWNKNNIYLAMLIPAVGFAIWESITGEGMPRYKAIMFLIMVVMSYIIVFAVAHFA